MKVTVFGVGFVGLSHGAVLAKYGHDVLCLDVDAKKISGLKHGEIPFYEPCLAELVSETQKACKLHFTTDIESAVKHGDIIFIAVGTPSASDGSADLNYVKDVALLIGKYLDKYKIIVNKSTVPIGTVDLVYDYIQQALLDRNVDLQFDVASNPEFLKEGSAVNDCLYPDRVIIGADNENAKKILKDLYSAFDLDKNKILLMKARSAELAKYAANSMLAAKISMINEIANIAEKYGADIEEVRQGVGTDPRIGASFISPGPGYGGSCFPKDVRALIHMCNQVDFEPLMLNSIERRNNIQKRVLLEKIYNYFHDDIYGKVFALWGLAFKANTSDMRESVSHLVIEELCKKGASLKAYDPEAMPEAREIYSATHAITFFDSKEDAISNADGLIVLTEWDEFKISDLMLFTNYLRNQVIFDGRNLFVPELMQKHGIDYISIGR